jgi:hypothetical protein
MTQSKTYAASLRKRIAALVAELENRDDVGSTGWLELLEQVNTLRETLDELEPIR